MTSAMSHPHSCYSSRCRRRCSNVVSTFCFAFRGSFVLLSSFLVMTWKRMMAMPTRMAIACWMMRLMMVAELEFLYSEAPMSRTLSSIPRLPGLSAEDRTGEQLPNRLGCFRPHGCCMYNRESFGPGPGPGPGQLSVSFERGSFRDCKLSARLLGFQVFPSVVCCTMRHELQSLTHCNVKKKTEDFASSNPRST